MTRRPHLSVTPYGLAYVSGDWHDRDSALHAQAVLRTIWADLDARGFAATIQAERVIHQARAEQMLDTIVRNQT